MAKKYKISTLLAFFTLLFMNMAGAAPVTRKFGSEPLDNVIAASKAISKCAGLTTNKLAVMLLVPSWWETVGGSTIATPSPMTLSRADFGTKNMNLYSGSSFVKDERVFAHPGIGLRQIDDAGPLGIRVAAYERIDTVISSKIIAQRIANLYCSGIGTDTNKRRRAWTDWFACNGTNFVRCEQTFFKSL
jgi:hypothetical protein